jgi:hypothetical protein
MTPSEVKMLPLRGGATVYCAVKRKHRVRWKRLLDDAKIVNGAIENECDHNKMRTLARNESRTIQCSRSIVMISLNLYHMQHKYNLRRPQKDLFDSRWEARQSDSVAAAIPLRTMIHTFACLQSCRWRWMIDAIDQRPILWTLMAKG